MSPRLRSPARISTLLAPALVLGLLASCGGHGPAAPAANPAEVEARRVADLPETDPDAAAWATAPEHVATLLLQDQTEPKLLEIGIPTVRVRALHDGAWIAFRLEWDDSSKDVIASNQHQSDAAAVQLPVEAGGNVPDAAMGQVGRSVRVHLWKALWQARLDDPKLDTVQALYPNASPDHYPYQHAPDDEGKAAMAVLYAPARGVGNPVTVGRPDAPTQDLIAEGFGTLTALPEQVSKGRGVHDGKGWRVVITRPLDADAAGALRSGTRSYAAFAVWDGQAGNAGARKMRSGWVPLVLGS